MFFGILLVVVVVVVVVDDVVVVNDVVVVVAAFHELSVYPKKELPFFILFTAGLCSFTALLALLTYQYPEPMGLIAKTVFVTFIVSDWINLLFLTTAFQFYCFMPSVH